MRDRKLFKLLRKLNQGELKSLQQFLSSPYHNSNKRLPVFYNYLLKYAPEFNHSKLGDEFISKAIFGPGRVDLKALSRLQSDLFKKVEAFIVIEKQRASPVDYNIYLLQFLRERRLSHLFGQKLKKIRKLQSESKYRNDEYYNREYRIES